MSNVEAEAAGTEKVEMSKEEFRKYYCVRYYPVVNSAGKVTMLRIPGYGDPDRELPTHYELIGKLQGDCQMSKDEMLAALSNDRAITKAAGLAATDHANTSQMYKRLSEIAKYAFDLVASGEFDDRFLR